MCNRAARGIFRRVTAASFKASNKWQKRSTETTRRVNRWQAVVEWRNAPGPVRPVPSRPAVHSSAMAVTNTLYYGPIHFAVQPRRCYRVTALLHKPADTVATIYVIDAISPFSPVIPFMLYIEYAAVGLSLHSYLQKRSLQSTYAGRLCTCAWNRGRQRRVMIRFNIPIGV